MSNMAVAAEAENDATRDPFIIFGGSNLRCEYKLRGLFNCCKKPKDVRLIPYGQDPISEYISCSDDEKELAKKRGAGKCLEVGTRCTQKFLGQWCVKEETSFCCYNSRLSRMINEQGWPQLGRGFGDAANTVCTGFTPEELASLDFSLMDLSEFYEDVKTTMPNQQSLTQSMSQRVQDQQSHGYYEQ